MDDFGEMTVHFVHKNAFRPNATPLLFIHGWPGCFREVKKILPILANPTNPDDPVFDVVAPRYPFPVFAVQGHTVLQDAVGLRVPSP
jgi:pimeloyl-ACP methyl ester carboxylesterase